MSASPNQRPLVREGHELLPGYHSPQVDGEVRLNTNESPYPPPQALMDALGAWVKTSEEHRYPDREALVLRQAIADLHGVGFDNVFCGNGSNEVIQTVALTFGGPGRLSALFDPTFAMHAHISRIAGGEVMEGPRDENFAIAAADLEKLASHADITFLCSPNNPTGVIEPRENIVAALEATNGIVVVDEAYGQFADWSAQELQGEDVPLVVLRTFSKTWAMAGVRLGYAIGPKWMIEAFWKTALPYHLSQFTQQAGTMALQYKNEMDERVALLVSERERLQAEMAQLPLRTWPSQANFILLRPDTLSSDDLWQRLLDHSVLVRNCSSWPGLDGCLRVTIGTEEENTRFLTALREALA